MASILDNNDYINFSLKTGVPLKTTISFKKLGNTSMVSYLAPRVDEIEFDEDEENHLRGENHDCSPDQITTI